MYQIAVQQTRFSIMGFLAVRAVPLKPYLQLRTSAAPLVLQGSRHGVLVVAEAVVCSKQVHRTKVIAESHSSALRFPGVRTRTAHSLGVSDQLCRQ